MDWRTQWAERENARRRTAYDAAISRWAKVDGELRSMVEAARGFEGLPPQQAPGWLDLKRGERLLWLGSDAQLMEAPAWPALAHPGYASLAADQLIGPFDHAVPVTLNAIDRGPVAVTDRRVVLAGGRRREWAYTKLAGLGHLPNTPCTLMYVTNRAKVSGVRLDPRVISHFRFHLALGLAQGAGERAGFVAHLERMQASHQSVRPLPVAAVTAADAPSLAGLALGFLKTAVVGPRGASAGRRVAHLGVTFVALLILLALLTPETPSTEALAPGPTTSVTAEPTPTPTPTPSSPTPTPTPTPTPVVEMMTEKQPISFTIDTVEDSSLDKGVRKVRTRGVNGERTITYEVTYVDGEETARRQVRDEVTKRPVTQVVAVGTKEEPEPEPEPEPESECDPNYGGCVPIASDVDCADGSGNGPEYVDGPIPVIGNDIYGLDSNDDGVACE